MNKFIKKSSQGTSNDKHMKVCPICGTIDMWNENCDEVEELLSWRNK